MSLAGCGEMEQAVFGRFVGGLCPNIRELKFDLRGTSTGNDTMEVLGAELPGGVDGVPSAKDGRELCIGRVKRLL